MVTNLVVNTVEFSIDVPGSTVGTWLKEKGITWMGAMWTGDTEVTYFNVTIPEGCVLPKSVYRAESMDFTEAVKGRVVAGYPGPGVSDKVYLDPNDGILSLQAQRKHLSEALFDMLVALEVIRADSQPNGAELLMAAEEFVKHTQRKKSE